ncbi:MAG TPA: transketolase family protein [Candidatus Saccharimonadales bacterium]|nr:transketolase family protein [Candidatus Saccharimonadales bacterium]
MGETKTASLREALGEALVSLGGEKKDMVVVGADTTESMKTLEFGKKFPERFFNVGIAEQNMIGISAGLALSGKTVFCGTYVVFLERAIDQIRNTVAYCNLDVKIIGSHGGISVGPDGGSHQAIEDLSIMRAIPRMVVLAPADSYSTKALIRQAGMSKGPAYIRILRSATPMLYKGNEDIRIGKAEVLEGGSDLTIIANGIMVSEALRAASMLKEKGISSEVIDCHTIKPIDTETIIRSAKKTGAVVTAEDHNVFGGLGSAVAEVLSMGHPTRMAMVGVKDTFGESGDGPELMKKYGLCSENIFNEAIKLVKK